MVASNADENMVAPVVGSGEVSVLQKAGIWIQAVGLMLVLLVVLTFVRNLSGFSPC